MTQGRLGKLLRSRANRDAPHRGMRLVNGMPFVFMKSVRRMPDNRHALWPNVVFSTTQLQHGCLRFPKATERASWPISPQESLLNSESWFNSLHWRVEFQQLVAPSAGPQLPGRFFGKPARTGSALHTPYWIDHAPAGLTISARWNRGGFSDNCSHITKIRSRYRRLIQNTWSIQTHVHRYDTEAQALGS